MSRHVSRGAAIGEGTASDEELKMIFCLILC